MSQQENATKETILRDNFDEDVFQIDKMLQY